jgi:hypothetical protein
MLLSATPKAIYWSLVPILFFVIIVGARGDFYVWHDEDGIKHVSNVPRECITKDRKVIQNCQPLETAIPAKRGGEPSKITQPRERLLADATKQSPYGSCSDRANVYQERYERSGQASDLVCYQTALERELGGSESFACPNSAQYYQSAYERSGRSSDLVCYQQALEDELR